MATKKTSEKPFNLRESMEKAHERWEANNVKRQFAISEVTPSRHQSGTHGGSWTRSRNRMVSPLFDTKEEALAWADGYTPDEGNFFTLTRIDHQRTITRHVFVGTRPIESKDTDA